jgi:hypothetical protein
MNHLTQTTEHPPIVSQAEPRVDVRVDLYAISRDLEAIKAEIALRPSRGEILTQNRRMVVPARRCQRQHTSAPLQDFAPNAAALVN